MEKEELINKLKAELKIRGLSGMTVRNYSFFVNKFLNSTEKNALELNEDDVKLYLGGMFESKSKNTIMLAAASIKFLFQEILKKDWKDIEYSIKCGADFMALSFVKNAKDVIEVRDFIGDRETRIISKIEHQTAVDNINEIIDVSDAIMIARGDLGVEMAARQLLLSPIVQRVGGTGSPNVQNIYGTGTTNPFRGLVTEIIVSPFLGRYEWVLMERGRAVVKQVVWDLELSEQSAPNSEEMFRRDSTAFKASKMYGVGMLNDRFAYYSNSTTAPTVD